MKNRPLIQRNLFRRAVRRQLRSVNEMQREMIRVVLFNQTIFETVYEQAMQEASTHADRTHDFNISTDEHGAPIVDNLLKLFTWFLENGPELIRLIELIIGIFAEGDSFSKTEAVP